MSDPSSGKPWWEGDYVFRPTDGETLPSDPPTLKPAEPTREGVCRNCGQNVNKTSRLCPYCHTPTGKKRRNDDWYDEDDPDEDLPRERGGLVPMLGFFIAIVGMSLLHALLMHMVVKQGDDGRRQLAIVIIVEAIDMALVLIALVVIGRPKPLSPMIPYQQAVSAWVLGLPVLAGLLGINIAYHQLLRDLLRVPSIDPDIESMGGLVIAILTVCVQPAVMEELFFRYLALGVLRRYMGIHEAVIVSSVMFGMAHIHTPLSIPVLTLVGVGLGYMRVMSGSIALPMLMHFAHNLFVILVKT